MEIKNAWKRESPKDKIICDLNKTPDLFQEPPQNCPKCGNPVDGQYCLDAYVIGNSLHYQDLECNDCWRKWKSHEINYHDYDGREYENESHDERHELCGNETHEVPVFLLKRYKMIKYPFNNDEEYVAMKEDHTTIIQPQEKRHAKLTKKSFG
uniref:Uncharacterized protein n=1 Tax=Tanacetum cinerariifolium TaxID=118510 RepID=A0A6L2LG51_TANCI|nr:hypothetical protein [Tanacetum cinerariifolium]